MMSYFALVTGFIQRYDESAGMGTLVATMLPYFGCVLDCVDGVPVGLVHGRVAAGAWG